VAAAIMGDNAIVVVGKEQHLRVPVIGRQRPTMAEHDGLTLAPVLVEDLDAVLCRDRAHVTSPFGGSLADIAAPSPEGLQQDRSTGRSRLVK
jgi:hypothetical protein